MKVSDNAEEVLETLWIMTVERGQDDVSFRKLSVKRDSPEVKKLLSLNIITLSEERVKLTKRGLKEAEGTIRRHRLAERLMVDIFDLKRNLMEETACRFEHLLHREVEESICTLLGHPKVCPHNRPIPPGRCCRSALKTANNVVASIPDVDSGTKGIIAYLHTVDDKKLQKLMSMGILPGVSLEVVQKFPSYVFKVGHSQVAVDEEMAGEIFIRRGDV